MIRCLSILCCRCCDGGRLTAVAVLGSICHVVFRLPTRRAGHCVQGRGPGDRVCSLRDATGRRQWLGIWGRPGGRGPAAVGGMPERDGRLGQAAPMMDLDDWQLDEDLEAAEHLVRRYHAAGPRTLEPEFQPSWDPGSAAVVAPRQAQLTANPADPLPSVARVRPCQRGKRSAAGFPGHSCPSAS